MRTRIGLLVLVIALGVGWFLWNKQNIDRKEDLFVQEFLISLIHNTDFYKGYLDDTNKEEISKARNWVTPTYRIVGVERGWPGTEYHLEFSNKSTAIVYLSGDKETVRAVKMDIFPPNSK